MTADFVSSSGPSEANQVANNRLIYYEVEEETNQHVPLDNRECAPTRESQWLRATP